MVVTQPESYPGDERNHHKWKVISRADQAGILPWPATAGSSQVSSAGAAARYRVETVAEQRRRGQIEAQGSGVVKIAAAVAAAAAVPITNDLRLPGAARAAGSVVRLPAAMASSIAAPSHLKLWIS